ncbi:MAG: TonB-dependent receptor, partial [Verrucomicrobia bacterium]|nr:TonB-dependent receptor [Cytophagales bacterium]
MYFSKAKFLAKILFWLAFPVSSFAQFSISGKVSEIGSQQPLSGANIVLQNTFKGVSTQSDGNFVLSNLPAGSYTLQISFLGYEKKIQIVDLQQDTKLNISLEKTSMLADEIIVSATRATEKTATTFSQLDKQAIEKLNLGQDLPFLLNQTPSTLVYSDAGAGVGYTGIRIRGSDPTRINVTLNGIPVNDAESQGVFWVNMPDLASSLTTIQIQRGVGNSTNGAGAFGASVNMQTQTLEQKPLAEVSNSFGSFNTRKHTVKIGTGLLYDKFAFDARLSNIYSDGFIDRAFTDLSSWFVSGGYFGKKTTLKMNIFSGKEQTYQSWFGVPQSLINTNRTYNFYTYSNQTDNYKQDHVQLFFVQQINNFWELSVALHGTKGKGYFEEYKTAEDGLGEGSFAFYGLPDLKISDSVITATDLVRRRWLENDFYGVVYSANYQRGKADFTLGGSYNVYTGKHFGELIWTRFAGNSAINDRYYEGSGLKKDFNFFGKLTYQHTEKLNSFIDLQYRNVNYKIDGQDPYRRTISQNHVYHFFNPKVGLNYVFNGANSIYSSYSVAHREPTRDDFIQAFGKNEVRPERLDNLEAGWKYKNRNYTFSINGFLMDYTNQLVLTGQVNDVGAFVRTNVAKSYRLGMEADFSWKITRMLDFSGNIALSRNKISNFTEFIPDFDTGIAQENNFAETDIAFS